MKKKKVIIIGAGIAGLSAASYLQRNGYQTEIFEAHSLPGGVCTSWKRGDYTFDYCVHWLMGTKKGTGFDILWEELGALKDKNNKAVEIKNFKEFTRIELSTGETIKLYSNLDQLQTEFLKIAPEDKKEIKKFIKEMKTLSEMINAVDKENWDLIDYLGYYKNNLRPFLKVMKYAKMTMKDLAQNWQNPGLQELFKVIIPPSWSALSLLFGMAFQHVEAAGYPVGGSLALAKNIEKKCLELGVEINYNSRVEKIITRENKAIGINLENGKEYYADYIVSAADGHSTLFNLLEGNYLTPQLEKAYNEYSLFPSSIHLAFGVSRDLKEYPHALVLNLDQTLSLEDGSEHNNLSLNIYNFDPTLAPAGKTTVTVIINTWKTDYWEQLAKNDYQQYNKIKEDIAEKVLEILDSRIDNFSSAVEKIDVSTPHTVKRYTSNWQGSYEGFAPTPAALMKKLPKEIKGFDNFQMIGQWTEAGGGIPAAALDGRNLCQKLCKKDKIDFKTAI
ncbi:MAG: phytoene desaturase family protein [Halanaerobium sp.]